jgi:hypothetical protein
MDGDIYIDIISDGVSSVVKIVSCQNALWLNGVVTAVRLFMFFVLGKLSNPITGLDRP